ncbi:ATP-binding protein [Isoptericola sp. b490]|uniref:ATP-binding protein n=1 Tax=Actinotalea lenta TaxID=3064654 RepID=UPI002712D569|nr:ATP-binding protein [Isoptericola sp. b490]MDO8119695.1 ATP-binding protein [Isoptericola sp. b490]
MSRRRPTATQVRHLPTRVRTWPPLGLPAHRASSATLSSAYPFLVPPSTGVGVPIGVDALAGGAFGFDPWGLYNEGELTNPNVVLVGVVGAGKSALAKCLAYRSIAAGRRVYVPGDPKGEWSTLAREVGGIVVRLGPGLPARLNPLDAPATADAHGDRLRRVGAITATALGRDLRPAERSALDAALALVERDDQIPTLPLLVEALTAPDEDEARRDGLTRDQRTLDGTDLAHGLRRLVRGDLAGLFDGPTTDPLDPDAPLVVLDLSALGAEDDALAIAMTCASGWLEAALRPGNAGTTAKRWVIYDEAWRLMRQPAVIRRLQAQWKLARALGVANLLVLHRLSDLDAVGPEGSEARALAAGLLADCSTRIVYRQESDQLSATAAALGLTRPERDLLPALPRGTGLWKLPRRSHVVHHLVHPLETFVDTDHAMREEAP